MATRNLLIFSTLNTLIEKIKKLIQLRLQNCNSKIDPTFLKYLLTYTKKASLSPINQTKIQSFMANKSDKIKAVYYKIEPNETNNSVVYFLLRLSELRKRKRKKLSTIDSYTNVVFSDLKKGALGFKVGYFDDFKIHKMRNLFSKHVFEMHYDIYQAANIYSKLKHNNNRVNDVHGYFCDTIGKCLTDYENAILDIKSIHSLPYFYAEIWIHLKKIKSINLLNECFNDHISNPEKVLEHYKDNLIIKEVLNRTIENTNRAVCEFISKGQITDSSLDFFIVSNASAYDIWDYYTIEYNKIPYFITREVAEKILYIGKSVLLIRKISNKYYSFNVTVLSNAIESDLNNIIQEVNLGLKIHLYEKYDVFTYLKQAKQIFLCERADFTSTLYYHLQQHNKGVNSFYHKSIVHLLEDTILETFGNTNNFLAQIDVCILQNEQQLDYISLFCKLDFPLNTIFTKEIVLKYVSIFRFIWRLKKIENQLRLLKKKKFNNKSQIILYSYLNIVIKFLTYFFESVIEKHYKIDESWGIEEVRKCLNCTLDNISEGMMQVKGKGNEELDLFVTSLDSMCFFLSRSDVQEVTHNEVKHNLKDFVEKQYFIAKNIGLCDLTRFL